MGMSLRKGLEMMVAFIPFQGHRRTLHAKFLLNLLTNFVQIILAINWESDHVIFKLPVSMSI